MHVNQNFHCTCRYPVKSYHNALSIRSIRNSSILFGGHFLVPARPSSAGQAEQQDEAAGWAAKRLPVDGALLHLNLPIKKELLMLFLNTKLLLP